MEKTTRSYIMRIIIAVISGYSFMRALVMAINNGFQFATALSLLRVRAYLCLFIAAVSGKREVMALGLGLFTSYYVSQCITQIRNTREFGAVEITLTMYFGLYAYICATMCLGGLLHKSMAASILFVHVILRALIMVHAIAFNVIMQGVPVEIFHPIWFYPFELIASRIADVIMTALAGLVLTKKN